MLVQIQSEAEGCSIRAGMRHSSSAGMDLASETLLPALAFRLPDPLIVGPITLFIGGVDKTKDSS